MEKRKIADGCHYVDLPEAGLRILCGCPENAVKFLMKAGAARSWTESGFFRESGPNAILLSEFPVQNGVFRNLAEFPVLQMLYRQGMIVPGHPGNSGAKPMLIGLREQVEAQAAYIFHGNYGLSSPESIMEAGVEEAAARELFRMKLFFAFGSIRPTNELLDLRFVEGDALCLGGEVFLHREGPNRYAFIREGESVEVDLNLARGEGRQAPYRLPRLRAEPDDFSVIHTGEGDGWDPERPCMGSIVCWKGEYFLIDAGPNIGETLSALGIGMSEIRGVFQTHGHDDHFVGLTELLRADRRMEFYSTPLTRRSVLQKLCSLTSMTELAFAALFDFRDLREGEWNEVDGLQVMPRRSPHPVETDILFFRAPFGGGFRSYAHLADIASFSVLDSMVSGNPAKPGMDARAAAAVKELYLSPADVKKIDAGGGMIHGEAEDFRNDASGRIFISHTSREITDKLLEIGSRAPFGMRSALVPASRDYRREQAARHLAKHLKGIPAADLEALSACPRVSVEEGGLLFRKGEALRAVFLVLSGTLVARDGAAGEVRNLGAGSMVGEHECLSGARAAFDHAASCRVEALEMPCALYAEIVSRGGFAERIGRLHEIRDLIRSSELYDEELGGPAMDELASGAELRSFEAGAPVEGAGVFIVAKGRARIGMGGETVEATGPGGVAGEERVLFPSGGILSANAIERVEALFIPAALVSSKPVLRWRLHESFERRLAVVKNSFKFEWRPEYSVKNERIDAQHKELFAMVEAIRSGVEESDSGSGLLTAIDAFIAFVRIHIATEEGLMAERGYPQAVCHAERHEALMADILGLRERCATGSAGIGREALDFAKSWILRHTLLADRQYMAWLRDT